MKLDHPKEWFIRSARREGDSEVGAGTPPISRNVEPTRTAILDGKGHFMRIAFGTFVYLWRRDKGWNVEKLAQKAGIEVEEILEIERDPHCEPELSAVHKLAEIFKVPARRLLELAGLVEGKSPLFQQQALRFAARSESIASLTKGEREALEAFVAVLTEKSEG